uniref:Beta-defensin-like domain-containing protein n=1 Tax=Anolis carolinensis TaxID=28377 RepID=A0A803U108_ANOCA
MVICQGCLGWAFLHVRRIAWIVPVVSSKFIICYTQPPPLEDTIQCKNVGGFCKTGPCPTTFSLSGTCHGGALSCCRK